MIEQELENRNPALFDELRRTEKPTNELNRPGMSGDSSSWKGWGHVRWFIEEVPAGAA
ncbi:MmpS family membrane protein [Mycobacterium tuberculosis]|nr:MmpS family membrane protein [Mycobacterium tuberculosis]